MSYEGFYNVPLIHGQKKFIAHPFMKINVVEPMETHFKSPLKIKSKKINGAEFKIFPFNINCNSI
jgi:hypothetical protein